MSDEFFVGLPEHHQLKGGNVVDFEVGRAGADVPCEQVGIEPKHSPAARTLIRAAQLVDGDRDRQHGDRYQCHKLVADLWSSYFGISIEPHEVALAMSLLKIARTKTGSNNADDFTDLCGYGALAGELAPRK